MRKKIVLPVIFVLFAACSSPMLEWIETGTGTGTNPSTGTDPSSYSRASFGKEITDFRFNIPGEESFIRLKPSNVSGKTPITVILPAGSVTNPLTPAIKYIGKSVSPESGVPQDFSFPPPVTYRVTAEDGSSRDYEVEVIVKTPASARLIWFDLELPGGSYMAEGEVVDGSPGTVTLHVPSGTNPSALTAKIVQTGDTLTAPNAVGGTTYSGTEISLTGNFSAPVTYTVTAEDLSTKDYNVTVTVDQSGDTGIFDFRVTNVPNSKVVIGQKPRGDGKIPIVIQIPYGSLPPGTDENNMIAAITLSDPLSTINPGDGIINFVNQEAVYTVTAENGTTQDYVAVVSRGPQYYYVDGVSGSDDWPDYYNGGSPSQPFKTLAYAVRKAAQDGITKVLITGNLSAANGGTNSGPSAFAVDLGLPAIVAANKKITIGTVGDVPRTLSAGSPQRVLSITGGADLTFENINITGGNTAGVGGGIYVTGNSKVKFSGNITGNRAKSGGGVYVEAGTGGSDKSEFTLVSGAISGNTATGAASGYNSSNPNDLTALAAMDGGGGVYTKGNALFTLKPGGTISGNATAGAGGGVLVNGNKIGTTEYGLIMDGGKIINNTSTSSTYPHGGGGVYVARGAFEMLGGEITGNTANRQGGGVFVHWGDARFTASGSSNITGNTGVGSSAGICNRGRTELEDTVKTDKVYIWNYEGVTPPQSFTLADSVQIVTGIAFARAPGGVTNNNFIKLMAGYTGAGTDPIYIDLESHLENGNYMGSSPDPDWLGQKLIEGANPTLNAMLSRLVLNTFKGASSVHQLYNNYKIDVAGTEGKFAKKP